MINHTTKEWNVEAIRLLLPHHEAQILKLPLSSMAMEDEIVWLPEKNIINLPPCVSVPLYPWLLWSLWTSRNQYLFEDKMFTENEVLVRATRLAREWQEANLPKALPNRTPTLPLHPTDLAVSPSVIQCFSDAAWDKESGNSGLGWCFQGGSATICKQGSAHRPFVASALAAEAWALKKALKDAIASKL
uniref:RNase H type-1 domain-containing protein n=1 Tax=Brassica oleracea var. oleracea TaxID=109376 RepID=A0A0D3B2M5_BRAOL